MEVNFAGLHRTSPKHWSGVFRGRDIEAELAPVREPVVYNGKTIAPDEVNPPVFRRSALVVKLPAKRMTFTLPNHYSVLAADSRHPESECFQWGPVTVGRSLVMVGIPKDSPQGCLLFGAIQSAGESSEECENILAGRSNARSMNSRVMES